MKTKWKSLLNKQNAKHYRWPDGWDSAEDVARQLECSPERVREHLAPSIRAGEVEAKVHTIWCSATGRKVSKTGYRMVSKKEPGVQPIKEKATIIKNPKAGLKIVRVISNNKEVGIISKVTPTSMIIEWQSGKKTHSIRAIRRGELKLIS